ncbi:MAG: hypothetical protein ACREEM_22890 [Blastocatellia bacterium]
MAYMIRSLQDHFTRFRSLSLDLPEKILASHREHLWVSGGLETRGLAFLSGGGQCPQFSCSVVIVKSLRFSVFGLDRRFGHRLGRAGGFQKCTA